MPSWLAVSVRDEVGVCWEGNFILCLQRSWCDLQAADFALCRFKSSCWGAAVRVVGLLRPFMGLWLASPLFKCLRQSFPCRNFWEQQAKADSLGRSIQLSLSPNSSHTQLFHEQNWAGTVGLTGSLVCVSQPLKLYPKPGSSDCRAKDLRRARGEWFSQIQKVSFPGWLSTVCLSFFLHLRFKMLGNCVVLLLEWQFNSPVILSCYVSVTVTGIWKKLWFDGRVRAVCLAFPRNLGIAVLHHPSWLQKLLASFKISLVLFSLSPQSVSSLCWTMPRSIFSKTFDSHVCYKICGLCTVWV